MKLISESHIINKWTNEIRTHSREAGFCGLHASLWIRSWPRFICFPHSYRLIVGVEEWI